VFNATAKKRLLKSHTTKEINYRQLIIANKEQSSCNDDDGWRKRVHVKLKLSSRDKLT
jgi:hypothetical protein